jgi:hypothetical protein
VYEWAPAVATATVRLATPDVTEDVPSTVVPSLKVTVPPDEGAGLTVAVSATVPPALTPDAGLAAIVVVVVIGSAKLMSTEPSPAFGVGVLTLLAPATKKPDPPPPLLSNEQWDGTPALPPLPPP